MGIFYYQMSRIKIYLSLCVPNMVSIPVEHVDIQERDQK